MANEPGSSGERGCLIKDKAIPAGDCVTRREPPGAPAACGPRSPHLVSFVYCPISVYPSGPSHLCTPLLSVDLHGNQPRERSGERGEQGGATGLNGAGSSDGGACPASSEASFAKTFPLSCLEAPFLGQSKAQLPDCSFHGHWTDRERPMQSNSTGTRPKAGSSILLTLGATSPALGQRGGSGAISPSFGHSQPCMQWLGLCLGTGGRR